MVQFTINPISAIMMKLVKHIWKVTAIVYCDLRMQQF